MNVRSQVYLSFIIDNYETLPCLNRLALSRAGYISLRFWGPGVFRKEAEAAIAGNWRQILPGEQLPDTIASQCCAQFAVTRQAILRRPKADYERMRQWLIDTLLVDDVSGRVFEKLWAYIFTGEAVHCPPPQQCACEYFGRCEERTWTQPPESLATLPSWP
ncbi:hypothetical protein LTR85_002132 [Meristemomyces frigidus]|nr:hypothetical protein LTR85_002132 [Meristemomyces frigidus]